MSKGYERPQEESVVDYQRKQEIIFDLSMELGMLWEKQTHKFCQSAMDIVNGSRGLFDMVMRWVEEFDQMWEALPKGHDEDYISEVRGFAHMKLAAFVDLITTKERTVVDNARQASARRMYLARFDENRRRVLLLQAQGKSILTAKEINWLSSARDELMLLKDSREMRRITNAIHALVGKMVVLRNEEGVTFKAIGELVGLSGARILQYAARYKRMLRSVDVVGLRDLPWHELKQGE